MSALLNVSCWRKVETLPSSQDFFDNPPKFTRSRKMAREIIHNTVVTGTETSMPTAGMRISWGAVFAGAVVALVTQLTLSILGIAIGASSIDPLTEQNPVAGIGTETGIWFVITSLLALFAGGWVAGRLAGVPRATDRLLHGILTWSLATLVTFYLLTTAIGGLIGGTANILSRGLAVIDVDQGAVTRVENAVDNARFPTEQRTRQAADAAASGLAAAAIWTFIFLVIGAAAAAGGGYVSTAVRRDEEFETDDSRAAVDVDSARTT